MLNNRKQSSASFVGRDRKRQVRRLLLETLERRECMAVDFTFAGGILNIIGDRGPNDIEIIWTQVGVQATGDGEQHTFEGVDEVFVVTGDGDDVIQARGLPNELVRDIHLDQVTNTLRINSGPGNDKIKIRDGKPSETQRAEQARQITIVQDLGTGDDDFDMRLRHQDLVNLDLRASDGGDVIYVGTTNGGIWRTTDQGRRWLLSFELRGGDNLVDVSTKGVNEVDLMITATTPVSRGDRPTESLAFNFTKVDLKNVGAPSSNEHFSVNLDLAESGVINIRDSLALGPVLTIHTGDGPDSLSIATKNVGDLELVVDTGRGNDTLVVDAQTTQPYGGIPGGIQVAAGDIRGVVNLGEGNDVADIKIKGYSHVSLGLTAGAGNDSVKFKPLFAVLVGDLDGRARLNISALLGAGNDRLSIDGDGYREVTSYIDAGAGNDEIRYRMFAIVDRTQPHVGSARLNFFAELGAGSDFLDLETFAYRDFKTTIFRGPAGDGRDTVVTRHVAPSRGRVSGIRLRLDGGRDTGDFSATGYDRHNVQQIGDTGTHEVGHWLGNSF